MWFFMNDLDLWPLAYPHLQFICMSLRILCVKLELNWVKIEAVIKAFRQKCLYGFVRIFLFLFLFLLLFLFLFLFLLFLFLPPFWFPDDKSRTPEWIILKFSPVIRHTYGKVAFVFRRCPPTKMATTAAILDFWLISYFCILSHFRPFLSFFDFFFDFFGM